MSAIQKHINNSNLSLRTIAKKSSIDLARLMEMIEGKIVPNIREYKNLSNALQIPLDFIMANEKKSEEAATVLFRSTFRNSKELYSAEKTTYYIHNVLNLVTTNFKTKNIDFSQFPQVSNTYEDARKMAYFFRHKFFKNDQISPITQLNDIVVNKLNCVIYIKDLGVVGASAIVDDIAFIFLSPQFVPRMLFTLAHELGHLLAHHSNNSGKIDISIKEFNGKRQSQESFANAFASNLLLPDEGLGVSLKKIREVLNTNGPLGDIEINYLARFYGISFEVAARRCEDIGLLPPGGAISMYETIKKKGSNPEKRAAEYNLPPRESFDYPKVSSNLVQSAIERISTGDISVGRASEILSMPISDLFKANLNLQ